MDAAVVTKERDQSKAAPGFSAEGLTVAQEIR
jgi:hypothetical protein